MSNDHNGAISNASSPHLAESCLELGALSSLHFQCAPPVTVKGFSTAPLSSPVNETGSCHQQILLVKCHRSQLGWEHNQCEITKVKHCGSLCGNALLPLFVCEIVYLQFSLFLLQHFPEYLSGMFLYFWILKITFIAKFLNYLVLYDNEKNIDA